MSRQVLAGALLALVSPIALLAQATTATISGTVTDSSGAIVPNIAVTAINVDTNLTRSANSNETGEYIIRFLPVGTYRVEVIGSGFKKYEQTGVVLDVSRNARVDPVLQVGAQSEQVSIVADAPLVNTSDASVGQLTTTTEILNLPLVNHDVYQLLTLTPGIGSYSNGNAYGFPEYDVQVNGSAWAQIAAIGYFLDGGYNMSSLENGGLTAPEPDAVQEFRVTTGNYSAEFGRFQGGIVDVVMKSGTNSTHGSLFEYFRNDKLNANSWGSITKPEQRRNQFGVTVGSHIIRDKTFYFLSYEGLRQRSSNVSTAAVVPTPLERQGNFTASKIQPKDPVTGVAFPGGIIPLTRFDPVALKILTNNVPLANLPGNRFDAVEPAPTTSNQGMAKIDHSLSQKHLLSFSYFTSRGDTLSSLAGNLIWADRTFLWKQQNFNLNETWTVSPNTVNQFHIGYLRDFGGRVNTPMTSLGDLGSRFNVQGPPSLPQITVSGYFTLGNAIQGPVAGDNFYQVRDTVSVTHGRHTFKAGVDASLVKVTLQTDLNNYGTFSFNGTTTGNALGDYLIGLPVSFNQDAPENKINDSWYLGLFVQDDFRVTRRLTMNIGLRYDVQTPFVEPHDQTDTFVPGVQSKIVPAAPTGVLFPGDPGIGRGIFPTRKLDFSPRLGLAWDIFGDGKTSFRAGFGQFYSSMSGNEIDQVHDQQPFTVRQTFPRVKNESLSDPYADLPGDASPFPYIYTPSAPRFLPPSSISGISRNFLPAYSFQLNATLQRQLTSTLSVSAGYVGSLGRHLPVQAEQNYPLSAPVCVGSQTTNCASQSNFNSRRPIEPGILGAISLLSGVINSDFHSLQTTVEKRLSHGVSFRGYYIFGKGMEGTSLQGSTVTGVMDPRNYKLDRARNAGDAQHRFVVSAVWHADYLHSGPRFAREIVNGWSVSPIVTLRSGTPFSISSGVDSNLDGSSTDRANLVGNPFLSASRPRSQVVAQWFNTAAFAAPPLGTDGTSGRNILDGPGTRNVDLSISRDFKLRETIMLQFRGEMTNAFNFVNLSSPVSTLTSGNFGQITSAGAMRQSQLGLRLTF